VPWWRNSSASAWSDAPAAVSVARGRLAIGLEHEELSGEVGLDVLGLMKATTFRPVSSSILAMTAGRQACLDFPLGGVVCSTGARELFA